MQRYRIYLTVFFGLFLFVNSCEKKNSGEKVYRSVNDLLISQDGTMYLATSEGLCIFHEETGEFELLEFGVPPFDIHDLIIKEEQSKQELWLATHHGVYNFSTRSFSLDQSNSELPSNEVFHLLFGQEQESYFATSEGLSILIDNSWIHTAGTGDLFLSFEITDMGSASNGYVYICTNGGGVERFRTEPDGITGATCYDTEWSGLKSMHVNSVFIDDTLQAYGTSGGAAIHYSEYAKKDWQVYTVEDGLIGDTVLSIARDLSGNWWFGTQRGISRLSDTIWTNYSTGTHPIISNHVKHLALDLDGSIWMATDDGLSKFNNEQWTSFPQ